MDALELVPATRFDSVALAALFARGYEGYFVPVHLDAAGFDAMVRSGDIDLEASRVACVAGEPGGVAILGVRGRRGWVGGVGVIPQRRGRGDGRALMNALITIARERGLETLALEVLVQNAPAIGLYESLGFRDTRTLDILSRAADSGGSEAGRESESLALDRALALAAGWEVVSPPWQREARSIERSPAGLEARMRTQGGVPVACVIYRARKEQLGIAAACAAGPDRAGQIRELLAALLALHPGCGFQIINLPADDPASVAMKALGARVTLQQREMVLKLTGIA